MWLVVLWMTFSMPVFAYIDGGSTGIIMQVILGAIAAAAACIKVYWFKIKMFFKRK